VIFSETPVAALAAGPCSWTWRTVNLWSNAKACGRWLWNEWHEHVRNIVHLKWHFKITNNTTRVALRPPSHMSGLLEIIEWSLACDCWTQTSWQVMQLNSDTADSVKPRTYCVKRSIACMGAIWWGTQGTCVLHFFRGGYNMPYPPHFFSSGFIFGEVPKIQVTFDTFCVECFSY